LPFLTHAAIAAYTSVTCVPFGQYCTSRRFLRVCRIALPLRLVTSPWCWGFDGGGSWWVRVRAEPD